MSLLFTSSAKISPHACAHSHFYLPFFTRATAIEKEREREKYSSSLRPYVQYVRHLIEQKHKTKSPVSCRTYCTSRLHSFLFFLHIGISAPRRRRKAKREGGRPGGSPLQVCPDGGRGEQGGRREIPPAEGPTMHRMPDWARRNALPSDGRERRDGIGRAKEEEGLSVVCV